MAPRVKKSASPAKGVRIAKEKGATSERGSSARRPSKGRGIPGRLKKVDKSKHKDKKKYTIKLKGWLQTPADWARFNAWAKINAQPKKIPEPEPICRPSKPLSQLRRRLKFLAQPRKAPDMSIHCIEWKIPKTALRVVASRRLILLALPNVRLCDYGRVYYKVSPAALTYVASPRLEALAQPRIYIPEECREGGGAGRGGGASLCEKREVDEDRLNNLALAKKLLLCPDQLTPEEIAKLFTPYGIKRTALEYKITPWVKFLALPSYKRIRHRRDTNAVLWKKIIIEEGEERGKAALAEQMKEREEKKRRGKKRKHPETEKEPEGGDGDAKEQEEEVDEKTKEEEERKAKRRRIEKHAWRFVPYPCKDDPFRIKRAALKATASPRMEELAKPNVRKNKSIRANPFVVRKGALSATATPRVESLAKPTRPRSPVEKRPPREKDKYGSPIFPMPVYGKRLPKTKPYKMGECPPAEKKKVVKKRPIDPIAYEQTYDPCIYPDLARRQKRERKRAEKLSPKQARRKKKQKNKQRKVEKAGDKTAQEEETVQDKTAEQETEE